MAEVLNRERLEEAVAEWMSDHPGSGGLFLTTAELLAYGQDFLYTYTYRSGNLSGTRQGTEHKRESEKRNLKGKNRK